jgi:hypothetical protein
MLRNSPTEAALFRPTGEPNNEARAAPKLNIMTVSQAPRIGNSLVIVATDERFKPNEMSVVPNGISPIFGHLRPPHTGTYRSQKYLFVSPVPDSSFPFSK